MFDWIADLFRKQSAQRMATEQLHAARVELLQSEYYAEHYANHAAMLQQRISRLEAYCAPSESRKIARIYSDERGNP